MKTCWFFIWVWSAKLAQRFVSQHLWKNVAHIHMIAAAKPWKMGLNSLWSCIPIKNKTFSLAESFYDVKYWNVNYHVKCSSENCWFLVCCFFSVIWNISQINVFKTKCKLKCQNNFLGNYFWNLETPVFIFHVFITEGQFLLRFWK